MIDQNLVNNSKIALSNNSPTRAPLVQDKNAMLNPNYGSTNLLNSNRRTGLSDVGSKSVTHLNRSPLVNKDVNAYNLNRDFKNEYDYLRYKNGRFGHGVNIINNQPNKY